MGMQRNELFSGPLGGHGIPLNGGQPGRSGCNGCTDCCHLPEISVSDEEAEALTRLTSEFDDLAGPLTFLPDKAVKGWQLLQGPCPFRATDSAVLPGGCRIYQQRPGSCRVFTCAWLLDQRRQDPAVAADQQRSQSRASDGLM